MDAEQRGRVLVLFSGCCAESLQQLTQFTVITRDYITHNRVNGNTVFVAFLDTRKAFDSVWIDGLLYKLYQKDIDSKLM